MNNLEWDYEKKQIRKEDSKMHCKSNDFKPQTEVDWLKESQLEKDDEFVFELIEFEVITNYSMGFPFGQVGLVGQKHQTYKSKGMGASHKRFNIYKIKCEGSHIWGEKD